MRKIHGVGLVLAGAFLAASAPADEPRVALDELARRASVIEPAADELRWQKIPWVTDLAEGQQLAKEEHRPILLWVTGDDPLERC